MRVLHIIESLEFGGAEKVVISIANAMASRHSVEICCLKQVGSLGNDVDPTIRILCMNKAEGNDFILPFRLAKLLRQGGYDVVHTHNWGSFLEGALAGILAGTRVLVHTVHGPYTEYSSSWLSQVKRALRHFLERLLSRRFRRIVAVSDSIKDYISESIAIPTSRLMTIHNGIPAHQDDHKGRMTHDDHKVRFITVGRLAAIKNHAMMLEAFAELLKSNPQANLTIVGDGPERAAIELRLENLGIANNVKLAGFQSDVTSFLDQADVFLLTSNYEGISIALLEAMRSGLPAICTSVGGIPETVIDSESGILVPAGDVTALARAMSELANSPSKRKQFGESARKRFNIEFSQDTMVSRYESLYGN